MKCVREAALALAVCVGPGEDFRNGQGRGGQLKLAQVAAKMIRAAVQRMPLMRYSLG